MQSKFDFFEKVRIQTTASDKTDANGKLGAVLGKAENDYGDWTSAVQLYDEVEGLIFKESELVSLGECDNKETFYSGETIRVRVGADGEGEIV